MEDTLQHEEITQCVGLTPAGPGNHRPNGSMADHALTFKLDHLMGADHVVANQWHLADDSPKFDCFECPPLVTDISLARFEQVHEMPLITCVEYGFSPFLHHFGGD